MGTRPSEVTLMGVRTLQTKGHQGQHGTKRRAERFSFEPASRPARVSSAARGGFRVGCDGDEGFGYGVGLVNVGDLFTGEVSGQAFLPEEVTAFDFAFGLRGWGVTKADAVEVQSLTQLGQSVGSWVKNRL